MQPTEFSKTLEQIALLKSEEMKLSQLIEPYAAQRLLLKGRLTALKEQALSQMTTLKTKRTEAVDGFYLVKVATPGYEVSDRKALLTWLTTNGIDLDSIMIFDLKALKALADTSLEAEGEVVPGITPVVTETVQVRTAGK